MLIYHAEGEHPIRQPHLPCSGMPLGSRECPAYRHLGVTLTTPGRPRDRDTQAPFTYPAGRQSGTPAAGEWNDGNGTVRFSTKQAHDSPMNVRSTRVKVRLILSNHPIHISDSHILIRINHHGNRQIQFIIYFCALTQK